MRQKNCRNPVSNRGPYDLQSYALPTELFRRAVILPSFMLFKPVPSNSRPFKLFKLHHTFFFNTSADKNFQEKSFLWKFKKVLSSFYRPLSIDLFCDEMATKMCLIIISCKAFSSKLLRKSWQRREIVWDIRDKTKLKFLMCSRVIWFEVNYCETKWVERLK